MAIIVATSLVLSSCNDDDDLTLRPDPVIVANAGPDQQAELGEEVQLNGNGTITENVAAVEVIWSFIQRPANSTAQLTNPTSLTPTFIPDQAGDYLVELQISGGGIEDRDDVLISAVAERQGAVIIEQNISLDATWTKQTPDGETDYILANNISVAAHLTVEPGVIVRSQEGYQLQIGSNGKLTAEGSEEEHIVFSGLEERAGYWRGIYFNGSNSIDNKLVYTEVLYGGAATGNTGSFNVAIRGTVQVDHSLIAHSANDGLHFLDGAFHSFSNNRFEHNQRSAIALPVNAVGGIDGTGSFENNGHDGVEIFTGDLNSAASWPSLNNGRYLISNSFRVNAALTIAPGAHFLMEENTSVTIRSDGTFSAIGTEADSIIFEGARQEKGYWSGIAFDNTRSRDNQLEYVRISHGGGNLLVRGTANLVIGAGSTSLHSEVSIKNSQFSASETYGVVVSTNRGVLNQFEGNVFKNNEGPAMLVWVPQVQQLSGQNNFIGNNGRDDLEVEGGTSAASGTWNKLDNEAAYYIKDNITFDHAMTIEAGSLLRFGENVRLIIRGGGSNNGSLSAKGTASDMIHFLPEREEVQQAYWDGIYFNASNAINNDFDYVEVAFAGRNSMAGSSAPAANILVGGSTSLESCLTLTNSLIRNSGGYGIATRGSNRHTIEQQNNTFQGNALGDMNSH